MTKVSGPLASYPARAALLWYLGLITTGTFVLTLPVCRAAGRPPISLLDAVFTATSAACVTGLIVRSTPQDFSFFGQATIAVLIQLGGIGIMTITTWITLRFGGAETIRHHQVVSETLGARSQDDIRHILRQVLIFVIVFEGIGFAILALRNLVDLPWKVALWQALFHSISAFCNAGFSLPYDPVSGEDTSLVGYQGDIVTNLTICSLIVLGGLGFPVILDLWRQWRWPEAEGWRRLQLHSKIMLLGVAILIFAGFFGFLLLESENALAEMSWGRKILVSLFQSITPRTAGFNTVDMARLTDATLFLIVLLMITGAGPCSTGGGAKVSTLMIVSIQAWSRLSGSPRPVIFRRTIPRETTDRAIAQLLTYCIILAAALTLLLVFDEPASQGESRRFLNCLFEVASALGTVGLSTGTTTTLNEAGRVIIILVMIVGRLGPISAFVALSRSEKRRRVEFPKEEILVG
jgi:trk system potassium uptake protein TrkH